MIRALRLFRSQSGASAAEFALVLPVLLILLFGIIDGGLWLWTFNKAEKATQEGARVAVVTNMIPGGVATQSFVGLPGTSLTQGDVIPASAMPTINCTRASSTAAVVCNCVPASCLGLTLTPLQSATWTAIATRMKAMMPQLRDSNIVVQYRGSGLGFAGDPNGPDVAPLVTVKITGLTMPLIATYRFATVTIPSSSTTLTAEDLAGNVST